MSAREFVLHVTIAVVGFPALLALAYWMRFDAPIWGM